MVGNLIYVHYILNKNMSYILLHVSCVFVAVEVTESRIMPEIVVNSNIAFKYFSLSHSKYYKCLGYFQWFYTLCPM